MILIPRVGILHGSNETLLPPVESRNLCLLLVGKGMDTWRGLSPKETEVTFIEVIFCGLLACGPFFPNPFVFPTFPFSFKKVDFCGLWCVGGRKDLTGATNFLVSSLLRQIEPESLVSAFKRLSIAHYKGTPLGLGQLSVSVMFWILEKSLYSYLWKWKGIGNPSKDIQLSSRSHPIVRCRNLWIWLLTRWKLTFGKVKETQNRDMENMNFLTCEGMTLWMSINFGQAVHVNVSLGQFFSPLFMSNHILHVHTVVAP